jgi:hypothetical protein
MTAAPPPSETTALRARAFLWAWGVIAVFMVMLTTVNALSVQRDTPGLDPFEPFIWEYSSAFMAILLAPGAAWLLSRAPPDGRWLRFAAVHLAGSLAYCGLHVGGFLLIRKAVYALLGAHYGSTDLIYEYRKDLLAYALFAGVFWIAGWIAQLLGRGAVGGAGAALDGAQLYALRDGTRTVRVALSDIVAVTSARNYVEFHLADGARPLVRSTLAKVEADLIAGGFLRTHRSWLVNPAHVRVLEPAAGGDFRLELATGVTAPLSRRFPRALEVLRDAA